MLFLSQVLGEEEDERRRKELVDLPNLAAVFWSGHTPAGGWGYVSTEDGRDFDEDSTTITQVQGLRGSRNAGILVPKGIIDRAIVYLQKCTCRMAPYSTVPRGPAAVWSSLPPLISRLFNDGENDS